MKKLKYSLSLFLFLILSQEFSFAQEVERNFLVGPQEVTCDSLNLEGASQQSGIEMIRAAKFRFQQSFKLTRKSGLQKGEFYSCGDLLGFLIIRFNDTDYLYQDVNKAFWDQLISSSDPEGVYIDAKEELIEY